MAPGSSPGLRLNFVLLRSARLLKDWPGATQEEFQLRRPSSGSVAERTGELDCLDSALGVVGSNTRVPFSEVRHLNLGSLLCTETASSPPGAGSDRVVP